MQLTCSLYVYTTIAMVQTLWLAKTIGTKTIARMKVWSPCSCLLSYLTSFQYDLLGVTKILPSSSCFFLLNPKQLCYLPKFRNERKKKAQPLGEIKPATSVSRGMCSTTVLQPLPAGKQNLLVTWSFAPDDVEEGVRRVEARQLDEQVDVLKHRRHRFEFQPV